MNIIKSLGLITFFLISSLFNIVSANDNLVDATSDQEPSSSDVISTDTVVEEEIDGLQFALNCSECHGFDGNSLSPVWPNLAGLNKNYIVKQLKDFKSGRRDHQEMKEVVSMIPSEKVYDALATYFSKQPLNKLPPNNNATKNKLVNLELGKEIYTGKRIEYGIPGCANCHGVDGLGGVDDKYPRLAGQHSLYIVNQMKLFRDKERTNDVPAMMQNISMLMDNEDIESVAAYIRTLSE